METLFGLFPKPAPLKASSQVYDLKTRLDWGRPDLTIIDVRDRAAFNESHITGAISLPLANLVQRASQVLEPSRDIYVYGATDAEAETAAEALRLAGYASVASLRGGVAAWKAVGFPIERGPIASVV